MRLTSAIPVVLITSALFLTADYFLTSTSEALSVARQTFTTALHQTRHRLVSATWFVIHDETLKGHLASKSYNALNQYLGNFVRPGEIGQIEILDRDCNLVARASTQSKTFASACRKGAQDSSSLRWQESSSGYPVLSAMIPTSIPTSIEGAEGSLIFVSHVEFDAAWLTMFESLRRLVDNGKISLFDSTDRGLIFREGVASGPSLSVRLGGWVGSLSPNLSAYAYGSYQPVYPLIFLFLCLYIFAVYTEASIQARSLDRLKEGLTSWIESRKSWFQGQLGDGVLASSQLPQVIEALKKGLDGLMQKRTHQSSLMQQRQDQLTLSAIEREKQIAELKDRLAGMSDLASLKEQLQHSTGSFLHRMQEVRESCENIFDLTSEGIAKQGKFLNDFCQRWKSGIHDPHYPERGARKFFRTLSETPGTPPFLTKLDEELDVLTLASGTILDQSLHLVMASRQALADIESGVQLAGLWHGLAMQGSHREKTTDWCSCLVAAQSMIASDPRFSTLAFEKLPVIQNSEEIYPEVPRVALVSGMFHLYMALLADITIETIDRPIVLRQKQFGKKGTMIFSLPQSAFEAESEEKRRERDYHMDLARAILAPLGLKVAFLPPTSAGIPVAFTWSLPGRDVEVQPEHP